jgi:hypothetical protein
LVSRVALIVTLKLLDVQPMKKSATPAGALVLDPASVGERVPFVCESSPRLIVPLNVLSPAKVEPHRGATVPWTATDPLTLCAAAGLAMSAAIARAAQAA